MGEGDGTLCCHGESDLHDKREEWDNLSLAFKVHGHFEIAVLLSMFECSF